MQLDGQRTLVTGAGDGLGRAIARAFAAEGARLVLFDIDGARAEAVREEIEAAGGAAVAVQGSVAEREEVERAFELADSVFGGVDILVNNAGVSANMPTLDISDEDWARVLAVNLTGPFLCARAAGRRMVAQRSGVILNMASMYGVVAAPERLPYTTTKSAVCMMTRALAVEWGGAGVRVNAIAPGYVRTALVDELVARGRLDLDRLRQRTPLGRLAEVSEIADLAVFACSPAAGFITGQILGIDGGWTANGYL